MDSSGPACRLVTLIVTLLTLLVVGVSLSKEDPLAWMLDEYKQRSRPSLSDMLNSWQPPSAPDSIDKLKRQENSERDEVADGNDFVNEENLYPPVHPLEKESETTIPVVGKTLKELDARTVRGGDPVMVNQKPYSPLGSYTVAIIFTTPSGVTRTCSGSMISDSHVLTAAQCLYTLGCQDEVEGWSQNVLVIPGMTDFLYPHAVDSKMDTLNLDRPHSFAKVQEMTTWGYNDLHCRDESKFDVDYGLILLDRPLGRNTESANYGVSDTLAIGRRYVLQGYPASLPYDGTTQYTRFNAITEVNNSTIKADLFICEGDSGAGLGPPFMIAVAVAVEPSPGNPNCGTSILKRLTPNSVSNIQSKQESQTAPPDRAHLVQLLRDDREVAAEDLIKLPTRCIRNEDIQVTFHAINLGFIDTGSITTSYYYSSSDPHVLEDRQFITSKTFASLTPGMYAEFTATIPCPDTLGKVYLAAVPFPTAEEYSIDLDLRTIPLGSLAVDCSAGCPLEYIDDGICDSACLVEACNYDENDCCGNGTVDPGEECESDVCCNGRCQFASSSVECNNGKGLCDGQGECDLFQKAEIKSVKVPKKKIKKTKVQVTWSLTNDEPVDEFQLQYRMKQGSWQSWNEVSDSIDGGSNKMTVTGLEKGTKYQVRVRSKNVAGNSSWKTSKTFKTKK